MKLIITLAVSILTLRVESQTYFEPTQFYDYYTGRSYDNTSNINLYGPTAQIKNERTEHDSYLQTITRTDNSGQQDANRKDFSNHDDRIHFIEPKVELSPPPLGENVPNLYLTQQYNTVLTSNHDTQNIKQTAQADNVVQSNITIAVSNFGLRLIKIASQLQTGNVIVSPISVATMLALLQQGATGGARGQISNALQMPPDVSESAFSQISTTMRARSSNNLLSIANNIFVADSFELNNAFKTLAVRSFWSEVSAANFANPLQAVQNINSWVAAKTSNKIKDLLTPAAVSPSTQLVLVNAVYFKGIWETKFKPERTKPAPFHLGNGAEKIVPFMNIRWNFQVGFDLNTRALVTILPFEGKQYSLILILPKKTDNVANVLSTLTVEQLVYYQTFKTMEIEVQLPKFTLKTNTDLNPVLRNMGITNIFGSTSDLSGIGLYRNFSPQITSAIHSGFLSVDEEGVTAAASTAFAGVALSLDDSSLIFKADKPFIAVLWDRQFAIPLFMAKIEDPS